MAIHAAVSARALALVHQARDPVAGAEPAERAYRAVEVLALRLLNKAYRMGTPPEFTVAQATRLIAILGGFDPIGDRRYGPITLGRGLERVLIAADALAAIEPTGPPQKAKKARAK